VLKQTIKNDYIVLGLYFMVELIDNFFNKRTYFSLLHNIQYPSSINYFGRQMIQKGWISLYNGRLK